MLFRRCLLLPASTRHSARYSTSRRPYTFYTAAQWAAKPSYKGDPPVRKTFAPTNPIYQWRQQSLQRHFQSPSDPPSAGEDFFLCTSMRHNSGVALAVADGVGGWADQGVDCSMFSQALMYHANHHFEIGWAGEPEVDPATDSHVDGVEMTPSECLQLAYYDVLANDSVDVGSSTACLATLNASSGVLRSANLGDSGLFIIRSSSVFYHSPSQTHYFNCPRQLAKLKRGRNRDAIRDYPSHADTYSTRLKDGDIVILYTDGLVDNVFPAEILQICSLVMKNSAPEATQMQSLADYLVAYSRSCMFADTVSPFQQEAKRHRLQFPGGKVDDSTVVVALVRET